MGDLIVKDTIKRFPRRKLETTDKAGRDAFMPLTHDWVIMNPDFFTYVNANEIGVDESFDITLFFQVGDKLAIEQSGSRKYFYIHDLDTTDNSLNITAGTSYTFTSATIDIIEFSRFERPFGFPSTFTYNPAMREPSSLLAGAPFTSSYKFWLNGRLATVDLHFDNDDLSGPTSSLVCDLPINPSGEFLQNANSPIYPCVVVNNFVLQTGLAKLGSSDTWDVEFQIIEFPGGGGSGFGQWATSTNGVGLDATFTYLI